ncbi:helix-turn-helix domain-containing protein [Actinacidiphila yeochonensis]|uniref:helix-turn-helix domain-containing protein n=1 Tax=Actinacidiphila yeochonensis TaxID=89050 RepID=UPI001E293817|nr:helix-turn-helix transcriptional regulator [Actinacidiphila yeochonensis]
MVGEARRLVNREEIGPALRALRLASGKEAKVVARSAAMSASKLSRIETGKVTPSLVDVEHLLVAVGGPEDSGSEILAAARAASMDSTTWRQTRRMGTHRAQLQVQGLEARMTLLRLFQSALVPGLLQTPEYMRAVLSRHGLSEDQLTRTMQARMDRQRVLYDGAKELRFVITESVLRWRLVPPPMMAGQLDRIISVSRLPNVDVRIVVLDAPQHDVPNHAFVIRDDRVVTVEIVHAELAITEPRDVALYVGKFEGFAAAALSGPDAQEFMAAVRDGFLRERETG